MSSTESNNKSTRNTAYLLGWYGGDFTHSQAAWTSSNNDARKRVEEIPRLLNFLADNDHGTPFERSLLHFSATVDTATHIHILKHRHFSVNGESARYKEYKEDKYYLPQDKEWRGAEYLAEESRRGYARYHYALAQLQERGMSRVRAKESARYFLPYSTQINLDFSCNFRAFVHFQRLRNSESAQLEIREIAQSMLEQVKNNTNDAFKYSLEAWRL